MEVQMTYRAHVTYRDGLDDVELVVDAPSEVLAAEKAERVACDENGGYLDWWFCHTIAPL
jgi:hypothetical protein